MPTTDEREAAKRRYHLTDAQYQRWHELLHAPAVKWPASLQRRMIAYSQREGLTADAVRWAVADYVRRAVPKTAR